MLNPSLNRRVTGKGAALLAMLLALGLTLPLAALSSQAPPPKVSEIPLPTLLSPKPIEETSTALVTPTVVQRITPKTVAVITASPVAEAESSPVFQEVTATLTGTVTDPTGALIPGVPVSLTGNSTGVVWRTLTNESGNFSFTQLPRDTYSGTAELPGFQRAVFSYLVAEPGASRLRIPLAIAPLRIVVNISTLAIPGAKCADADCGKSIAPIVMPIDAPKPVMAEAISANSTQAEIPANGRRDPIRVGGNIQTGLLQVHPNPAYPSEARGKGIEGVVVVGGVVAEDGQIRSLKILGSSSPLLEASVLDTLQSWRYSPTLLNREPVEVMTVITLNFTLGR